MKIINSYLNHLLLEGKAKNTVKTYQFHLSAFNKWLKKEGLAIDEVRSSDMVRMKEHLLMQNKAERTVNAVISCVKGFYDFLILVEQAKFNPVSDKLRINAPYKRIERLSDEEIRIFVYHISKLQQNIKAAFHLMLATGARVGEVTALKKGDFTITEKGIFINIEKAKWGSDRIIPIVYKKSAQVVENYLETIDLYNEPAFRVSRRTLQTYATDFAKETGIKFSCHILRHTFATLLLERGVKVEAIQYMLGHKTPNVTRHYTQGANINVEHLASTIWQGVD